MSRCPQRITRLIVRTPTLESGSEKVKNRFTDPQTGVELAETARTFDNSNR